MIIPFPFRGGKEPPPRTYAIFLFLSLSIIYFFGDSKSIWVSKIHSKLQKTLIFSLDFVSSKCIYYLLSNILHVSLKNNFDVRSPCWFQNVYIYIHTIFDKFASILILSRIVNTYV